MRLFIEALEDRTLPSGIQLLNGVSWEEQGPGVVTGGGSEGIPANPVTGAVEAIAVHPDISDAIFLATVNGGIWRTETGSSDSPDWEPLTDTLPNNSMGDITFSPDLTPDDGLVNLDTLYGGFGRFSAAAGRGGDRTGVLKTTNFGSSWTLHEEGLPAANFEITSIVPTTNLLPPEHVRTDKVNIISTNLQNEFPGAPRSAADAFGYQFTSFNESDSALDGKRLPLIDAVGTQVSFPSGSPAVKLDSTDLGGFQFDFYGDTYSEIHVGLHGIISFGEGVEEPENTNLSMNPVVPTIAPFWDELVIPSGSSDSGVYYQVDRSRSSPQLIIQWNDLIFSGGDPADTLTFQAALGADGSITINYVDLDSGHGNDNGLSATVGIKDAGVQRPGTNILPISVRQTLSDSQEVWLAGIAPPPVESVVSVSEEDAENAGIYRSTDGGRTWEQVSGQAQLTSDPDNPANTGIPHGPVTSLVADPAAPNTQFFAAVAGDYTRLETGTSDQTKGVYRRVEKDGDLFWEQVLQNGDTDDAARIELAVHESDSTVVLWAALIGPRLDFDGNPIVDSDGNPDEFELRAVYRSDDAGQSWTSLAPPTTAETDQSSSGNPTVQVGLNPGGQALIHFSLAADPDVIYVGGDRQPLNEEGDADVGEPNSIGASESAGRLFLGRFNPSGGNMDWEPITHNNAQGTAPHADSRDMVIHQGKLLQVDDGGIYQLNDPQDSAGNRKWVSLNTEMQTFETRSVAFDPDNQIVFAGFQDNGSAEQDPLQPGNFPPRPEWKGQLGGDGFAQAFGEDRNGNPSRFSIGNDFDLIQRRTPDASGGPDDEDDLFKSSRSAVGLSGLTKSDQENETVTSRPLAVNAIDPTSFVVGGHDLYFSADFGTTIRQVNTPGSGLPRNNNALFDALAFGGKMDGKNNLHVLYVSYGERLFIRESAPKRISGSDNAFREIDTPGDVSSTIEDIVLDPENWEVAYVTDQSGCGGSRMPAERGSSDWTPIGGNLPILDRSISDGSQILSLAFIPAPEDPVLVAGTLTGVYRLIAPGSAAKGNEGWAPVGVNLPIVRASDLHYDADEELLLVGTLGRGVWSIDDAPDQLTRQPTREITGSDAEDTITLHRSSQNPLELVVRLESADGTVMEDSFFLPGIHRIEVFGLEGADRFQIVNADGRVEPAQIDGDGSNSSGRLASRHGQVLSVPDGIHIFGNSAPAAGSDNAADQLIFLGGGTVVGDFAEASTPAGQIEIASGGLEQTVTWNDVPVVDNRLDSNESITRLTASGLARVVDRELLSGANFAVDIAVWGDSLDTALDVGNPVEPGSFGNSDSEDVNRLLQAAHGGARPLLARLLEDNLRGGALEEVTDPEAFRARLDALDDIPGNVTFSQTGNTARFDLQVSRAVVGFSDIDIESDTSDLALSGVVGVQAQVDLRLNFGVDDQGFFIDTTLPQNAPHVRVHDLQIIDVSNVSGRYGAVGVVMTEATREMNENAGVEATLGDPDGSGKIRFEELTDSLADSTTVDVVTNPNADDLVLTGRYEIAPLALRLEAVVPVAGEVTVTWPGWTSRRTSA